MNEFISIYERLPEDGMEVEAFRIYGLVRQPGHPMFGCSCGVERTMFGGGSFQCDLLSSGHTTHWKQAKELPFRPQKNRPFGIEPLIEKLAMLPMQSRKNVQRLLDNYNPEHAFRNDGSDSDWSHLNCPMCGGSGHVGDVCAGSKK